jgi:hypothetical protein
MRNSPRRFRIRTRSGCFGSPNAESRDARLTVRVYVWPDRESKVEIPENTK